jgi:ribosome-associated toxin RatA of RatAB toxin-antitoxin module
MPLVESSIEIAAAQADLFDLSQDYGLRLEWDPFVAAMGFRDGAERSAAGVRVWVRANNGLTMDVVFVTFERPRSVAMKMVDGPRLFKHFAGSWRFDAVGPSLTRVIFKYNFETRWLRFLLNPIIERRFARDIAGRLAGLKRAAEETDIVARLRAATSEHAASSRRA